MNKRFLTPLCLIAIGASTWSCIDDKYDLSDIDTTVQVKVDDLVIPINIDQIDLESIIDLDEDGIVQVVDGAYTVVKGGTIDSDAINVDPISIKCPNIDPTVDEIHAVDASGVTMQFPLSTVSTRYSFKSNVITDKIEGLSTVYADFEIKITFSLKPNPGGEITLSGVRVNLPKGLIIDENYNKTTGVYVADKVNMVGGKASLTIPVKGIDFGAEYYAVNPFDAQTHIVALDGELSIGGGTIDCKNSTLHRTLDFKVEYSFGTLDVRAIDGKINYPIDGVDISRIDINDLPDVLSQPGTNISLANPVIYFGINNPLQDCKLTASSGLSITAVRGGQASKTYSLDEDLTVGYGHADGEYNFMMCPAPNKVEKLDPEFPDPKKYVFSTLGNILSGDGIPEALDVKFVNPGVRNQEVENLLVGHNYGSVHGKYKFVAPLQFDGQSKIIYTDVMDGWYSEDMDYLTIETLVVDATISSNVPLTLDFTGYPIDKDGKRINNVAIEGAKVNANAKDQKVSIRITGAVTGLDGVEFVATAVAAPDSPALSPDMKITLDHVRPCVSGYYQKEL